LDRGTFIFDCIRVTPNVVATLDEVALRVEAVRTRSRS
jgi:hypothetical protein